MGNYPYRSSTNYRLIMPRVYRLGPGAREKPKSLEAGKTVASSMVAHKRAPGRSSHIPALKRIEAEYVEVASLRPNRSQRRAMNNPCGSRVGSDEAACSIGTLLGSLNEEKVKSGSS